MGGLIMKNKLSSPARHSLCLSALLTVGCVAIIFIKAFKPDFILPRITITLLVGLSLAAQLLEYWLFPRNSQPDYLETGLLAMAAFGCLTWAVGLANVSDAGKVGIFGGIVYTICLLVFRAMEAQLETTAIRRRGLALTGAALLLLLASQSLAGIPVLA